MTLPAELIAALSQSAFYARKLGERIPTTLADFPFTTKAELVADQAEHPPYGTNLTRPLSEYTRLCQTSGTSTGRPLVWLDTPRSWNWLLGCWDEIYRRAGVGPGDRAFFAFSFGPFLGFWTAFESAHRSGIFCLTGGGMTTSARLRQIAEHRATVVLCTPTYALHMAEVAANEQLNLPSLGIKSLIVAGEPGGLVATTRAMIEKLWSARVIDHYGLTELGPVAVEPASAPGALQLLDGKFIAEIIDPDTSDPATVGELVVTSLGRLDSPLIRYRTGDLARMEDNRLVGGILGRIDEMIHYRGNNIYPTALERIVRRFSEVAEYRVELDQRRALSEMSIVIEPVPTADGASLAAQVAKAISNELLFRAEVVVVPPGSLPRYEMKAKRFIRKQKN